MAPLNKSGKPVKSELQEVFLLQEKIKKKSVQVY